MEEWAEYFNDEAQTNYQQDALTQSGVGAYQPNTGFSEHIAYTILNSSKLTDEQKQVLIDRFGISDDTLYTISKDRHYE